MIKVLLVSNDINLFKAFESALEEMGDVDLVRADSGEKALQLIQKNTLDLAVAGEELGDMTGLEFAGRLVSVNPLTNCALTSGLAPGIFHEKSEGLGVMAQLPLEPGPEEARQLIQNIRQLKNLMGSAPL